MLLLRKFCLVIFASCQLIGCNFNTQNSTFASMSSLSGGSHVVGSFVNSSGAQTPPSRSGLDTSGLDGGSFITPGGLYFSNGTGFCRYSSINAYILMVGQLNPSGLNYYPSLPPTNGGVGLCAGGTNGTIPAGNFLTADGSVHWSNGSGGACKYQSYESYLSAGGTTDVSSLTLYPSFPWDLVSGDGPCSTGSTANYQIPASIPAGNFIVPGGLYFSNGGGGYCKYSSISSYILMNGTVNPSHLSYYPSLPPDIATAFDHGQMGPCQGSTGGKIPAGPFLTADGSIYSSDGAGAACQYADYGSYLSLGGVSNVQNLSLYPVYPSDMLSASSICTGGISVPKVTLTIPPPFAAGSSNITNAMQSVLLNQCNGGCEIHIPASSENSLYLDHSVVIANPNISIICDSQNFTLFNNFSADANENLFEIQADHFKMKGCSLNTRALATGAQAIHVFGASYGEYSNLVISDPGSVGVGGFSGIRFEANATGAPSQNNYVHDSVINSPYISFGAGVSANNNTAFNNIMTGCGEAFDFNGGGFGAQGNVFAFNKVSNCAIPNYFESASGSLVSWNYFLNSGGGPSDPTQSTIRVHLAMGPINQGSNNTLSHNTYDGQNRQSSALYVFANAQSTQVLNETIRNYLTDGIFVDSSDGDPQFTSISGGSISNVGKCGIHLLSARSSGANPMVDIFINATTISDSGTGICIDGATAPADLKIQNVIFSGNNSGTITNSTGSCNGCSIQN